MQLGVVSLFPERVAQVFEYGVTGRAAERGLLAVEYWNPRDFSDDRLRRVDDRAYGGGPGMVMQVAPIDRALTAAREKLGAARVVYLSPQGLPLTQPLVAELAREKSLILLCGRYEGIDERVIEQRVDMEISIGDYVLSGGELPAMVVLDAMARLIPGVLGDAASAQEDSFVDGILDHPHFTRPESAVCGEHEIGVPSVLLSGDHEAIRRWRLKQALGRTWLRRPELLDALELDAEKVALLREFIGSHGSF